MENFEVPVKKTLCFSVETVDEMSMVRCWWQETPKDKVYGFFDKAPIAEIKEVLEVVSKPTDLRKISKTLDLGRVSHGEPMIAVPMLVKRDARLDRIVYEKEPYISPAPESASLPDGARIVFANFFDNTFYDQSGQLLNGYYRDSITEGSYDLKAVIELAEKTEGLNVVKDRMGSKIYYVRGNGQSMTVEFEVTPEIYEKAIVQNRSLCHVDNLLREMGIDPESVKARERDPDDEPDMF